MNYYSHLRYYGILFPPPIVKGAIISLITTITTTTTAIINQIFPLLFPLLPPIFLKNLSPYQ